MQPGEKPWPGGRCEYKLTWASLSTQLVRDATVAAEDTLKDPRPAHHANLQKFLFILGLTIAHELVHFFIGRILGDVEDDTPKKIDDPDMSTGKMGESGRYWEKHLLGHRIERYWDATDPLGEKQAGALYAFDSRITATKVAQSWIKEAAAFSKSLPNAPRLWPGWITSGFSPSVSPLATRTVNHRLPYLNSTPFDPMCLLLMALNSQI
jgi:hypothetical protein